ncbi:ABC transporter permease [Cellulomonas citrea]|uniref:ABC transporter permease n=1 Tax=Cellulomonas citrea TaxID=1909423 RepID=UPI001356D2B2|nr:ABC transporter permease [Cellulomonas citrea]
MSTATLTPAPVRLRSRRLADSWSQTGLLIQWQLRRSAQALPLLVLVQIMLSVATIAGYGLLVGHPDHLAGLYLATGAPTVALITVGLVMTPQMVTQSRTEGSLDWLRTLPVPRSLFLVADLTVWTLIALPGLVLGIVAGAVRYDVDLAPTWWLVPAALLVSLTAAAVGYAMASLLSPMVAQLMSQVLVFVVLLFTPISFPSDRMPGWAQDLHAWLPLEPMAQVIRAGLAPHDFTVPGRSWVVLIVWCLASVIGAGAALRKRG